MDSTGNKATIRDKALDWFFCLSFIVKNDLKDKYFPNEHIQYDGQWGYHFTFGQLEEMYKLEHKINEID